ncbi:hypothetical protein ACI3K5_32955 [Streptomyces sp. MPA0124]|uniref:hypothetical protein n=1 Tax=Streptomyces sp. MPA0124 TaxID=3378069 RepID=UPI0038529593
MQFRTGQRHATNAQQAEDDPQKLFTEACMHGIKARLCDDVGSLDSYLTPHSRSWQGKSPAFWRYRERDIRTWLADWNEHPRPFVWTKSADEILDKVAAYCRRISDSGH